MKVQRYKVFNVVTMNAIHPDEGYEHDRIIESFSTYEQAEEYIESGRADYVITAISAPDELKIVKTYTKKELIPEKMLKEILWQNH